MNSLKRNRPSSGTFICPFCGTRVPNDAPACPECGSDETTGWSSDVGILPESDLDEDPGVRGKEQVAWWKILVPFLAVLAILAMLGQNLGWYTLIFIPVALIGYGLYVFFKRRRDKARDDSGELIYAQLLIRARGDEALVERLIEYERKSNPFRTRKDLLTDALRRWERDNR
jgi:hypothetical protein